MSADQQTLVSLVVVAPVGSRVSADDLVRHATLLDQRYAFSEVLIVINDGLEEALEAVRRVAPLVAETRVLQVGEATGFDDIAISGYREAIGDLVVLTSTDELALIDLSALLAPLHDGDRLVRVRRRRADLLERAGSRLVRALTGLQVDTRYLRTLGLSRELLSELLAQPHYIQMFRFRGNALEDRQAVIKIDRPKVRGGLGTALRRLELTARLVSVAAPRLLRLSSALCATLAVASLGFVLYTLAVWLLLDDVAAGWTSLALVLGTWISVQMIATAALCLGLSRQGERQAGRGARVLRDVSVGELFGRARLINVEKVEP